MDTLEQFFRFAGLSQLVVLAIVLLKGHRDKTSAVLIALWALSGACHLAVVPAARDWHWEAWSYVFLIGSLAWPVLFWLVAKALFHDGFQLRWHHLGVLVVVLVVSLVGGAAAFRTGFSAILLSPDDIVVPQMVAMAFQILAVVVVLNGWRDDLVESRRYLRLVLIVVSGCYAIVAGSAVFVLLSLQATVNAQHLDTIHAGIIFLLCLSASVGLFSVHTEFIAAKDVRPPTTEAPPRDLSPIGGELKRLMHEEHAYCETGLTIGRLAEKLCEKEYKLRRVINGEFGYRNFNDFLNQHRIAEAARRLVAPETRQLPVLTIALDVGYSSLGPFNRAFKELLMMTPTEYRGSSESGSGAAPVSDRCTNQLTGSKETGSRRSV